MLIPVISLYNPWAIWVGLGWKKIETRTHRRFASLVGKTIGIHAGLKWDEGAIETAREWLSPEQIKRTQKMLRVGGAICWTAFVTEHRELDPLDNRSALIDCTHVTRYGLFLKDVTTIDVITCRGKQGIWYYEVPEVVSETETRSTPASPTSSKQLTNLLTDFTLGARDMRIYEADELGDGPEYVAKETVVPSWKEQLTAKDAEIAALKLEVERLNKMRTHCENCGADYMATGLEAGCPCKLKAENAALKEKVAALEKQLAAANLGWA